MSSSGLLRPRPPRRSPALEARDLSVTALYTAQNWVWGEFEYAERFETEQSRGVFAATNLALLVFGLFNWGRPSLHKGLTQRHALIDQRARALKPCEVVELAAGLSARGLRFTQAGRSPELIRYTELDLPHVIQHKRALYQHSLKDAKLPPRLAWRDADVTQSNLAQLFDETSSVDRPRLIIAEGLFMYLDASSQRALWRQALEALRGGGVLIFDLVPSCEQPPPGLLGRALGALMARFTGGATFSADARGREVLCKELKELGFESLKLYDTQRDASELGLPYASADTQQLIFEVRAP